MGLAAEEVVDEAPVQHVLTGPESVVEGLLWGSVYWMDGQPPKGSPYLSEVREPPHLGWGLVFAVDNGGKYVTLFCPYDFSAHQVSRRSYEWWSFKAPMFGQNFRPQWAAEHLLKKWTYYAQAQMSKDFEVAALVMKLLGLEVPLDVMREGAEAKKTGGGEADVLGLAKPVKRSGKRGQILAFFLEAEGHRRSVHEGMAHFSITRSNLLSQLFLLRKEHGIGYELSNDAATVILPDGCEDPFTD